MGSSRTQSNMFNPKLILIVCFFFIIGTEAEPKPAPKPWWHRGPGGECNHDHSYNYILPYSGYNYTRLGKSCTDKTGIYKPGDYWTCGDGCNPCWCGENGGILSSYVGCGLRDPVGLDLSCDTPCPDGSWSCPCRLPGK